MKNPMLNEDFLLELEKNRNREVYARIILLDVNELPIEEIEGKVVSGSINIDGTSVVRRTCSLQLVSNNINIHDFYWGVKNKFKLEVGLLNVINNEYPDIIWFKQGIYVITAFSAVLGVNNYTISISGKDKMCLLNGDMAGQIMNISEDFGVKWIWKNDEHTEYIAEDIEIKEIIYKGVQTYAGELPQNIIINDIAECGVQLMEYRGKQPLYLIKNNDDKIYENMTVNGGMNCWYKDKETNDALGDLIAGNTGFQQEVQNYLVVTADVSAFYDTFERNQVYVEAGLFSMALVEALHYYGIGSCVLQNGEYYKKNRKFKDICKNIPENERIILFVAVGYYKEEFSYAVSLRKNVEDVFVVK